MKTVLATMALLVLSGTVMGQAGPGDRAGRPRGGGFGELKEQLSLTDTQIESLKALLKAQREALKPQVLELAQLGRQLREELQKDPVDAARVSRLRAEIQAGKNALQAVRSQDRQQLRSVLSPDQVAMLAKFEEALGLQQAARQAAALGLIEAPRRARTARQVLQNRFNQRQRFGAAVAQPASVPPRP
ncbi:MAG: periplasmic heavy metal sensor [Acidobacteria bacterium]|nr:periplasmic heavy metal sensor [Acidobacteriota bacterium]